MSAQRSVIVRQVEKLASIRQTDPGVSHPDALALILLVRLLRARHISPPSAMRSALIHHVSLVLDRIDHPPCMDSSARVTQERRRRDKMQENATNVNYFNF